MDTTGSTRESNPFPGSAGKGSLKYCRHAGILIAGLTECERKLSPDCRL